MDDFTQDSPFPFKTQLSLRLLVEYWEERIRSRSIPAFVQGVLEYIQKAPELKGPLTEEVLEKHRMFINFLMTAVVPNASTETELVAAIYPFEFKSIFSTEAFDRDIDLGRLEASASTNLPGNKLSIGKTIKACLMVLSKFHHAGVQDDKPVMITLRDHKTGLDKVYKVEINHKFCEIVTPNTPQPIDKHILKFLLEKIYDTDLLLQYIRPEDYEFQGFIVLRLVDVTEQEMLSAIKYDLLERDAVTKKENAEKIQRKLRSIFRIPNLRLGLAYFDPNDNLIINSGLNSWKSLCQHETLQCVEYTGSVYERAWMERRYITIDNLEEYPFRSPIEEALIKMGVKSLVLAPLVENNETIGMLELASNEIGQLNSISSHKVEGALPMFTAAVKRVKEEMTTEVRAIIQEECTTIHPTVQWRFFDAGVNLMNKRRHGDDHATFEEIVFKDVYPLFGLADVRNSSTERNSAVQQDLVQNLKLAKELLVKINTLKKLPLLDEVIFRIEEQFLKIKRGLASGDESSVLEFLKNEINPVVQHFEQDEALQKSIARYRANLDPVFGVVYKRRKLFEENIALINKTISTYLDDAEEEAQQMFPHYFEKYKTDGVEFTLYVGSSLVNNKTFDPFYLKNFRLWQLLVMVEIGRKIDALKPKMKNALDITQLVLVQDQPISIRFRADEKQFDVDGAYDIRYEIVKKRIDKALVKDTGERLTQPGKIAIVYSQARVEDEYRKYFQYLRARNLIHGDVEELELEELPGATGLRALRITIHNESKVSAPSSKDLIQNIEEALMN